MLTKNTLFRPSKAETKADSTTQLVRGIIDAETTARELKTARLRAARAERDASEVAKKIAEKPARPKKATKKKTSAKATPAN